ncbi:LamG-like jellyroll fold domain-containing protein [Kitasatospora sp. NPDC049258]|uniref:LamG-like jellyroll fold domain-containing protein n=1 Tax=Kitasatospora sp. NPDC049258 TaxID=3155394 RepID=UPI0034206D8E
MRIPSRRLTAACLSTTLTLGSLVLGLAGPAAADPTHDQRDAVQPVVSYTFDNDSGNTVTDGSSHGNNGSWTGTPAYAPGVSGRALHIGGGKNFVTLPRVAGQTDGSGSFSFETWWYDNTSTADAPLVANQNFASCANPGFTFYHVSGTYQQRSCYGVGGTKTYSTTRTATIRGGWHHLAVVQDATAHTYAYFVDGALFSTTPTNSGSSAANFNSGSPIRIGQDGTGAYSATDDALVDDFTFYNQAITADQVAADFAATDPATHFPVTVTGDGHGTGTAAVSAPAANTQDRLTAAPDPGYSFAGWTPVTPPDLAIGADGSFTAPGTAVTVKAAFRPNTYTVTFDGNGADGGSTAAQQLTYDRPAALTANGFTASGKQFAGWSTGPDGPSAYPDLAQVRNLTATDRGTVTLYARWAPAGAFQVTATGDEHTTVRTSTDQAGAWALPGTRVTATATSATGYGATWQAVSPAGLAVEADGSFTMPGQDVVLKAVSSPNRYTVAFDGNGADGGATKAQQLSYDQPVALTADGFSRTGYSFLGWATSPTGAVAYSDGQQVANLSAAGGATVTLYAVWGRYRAAGDTVAPVASYDFEADQGGAVTDGSGHGNDAAWKGAATYARGFSGRAAHISAGQVIQLPKAAGQTDGSGSFSFSMWWGEYAETVDGPLVSNQDFNACNNAGLSFYNVSGTTTTRACWGTTAGGTRQYLATNPAALQGNWHYLTVVVDRKAQTVASYLDGSLFTTSTAGQLTSATSFASGLPFMIGQDGTGGYGASVDALVDDFDFYDQALTPAQVANDYRATKPAATALPDASTVDLPIPVATLSPGFVADTFHAPPVRTGGPIKQPLAALWYGGTARSFTKVGGDSWLGVGADGTVTGTAPGSAPQHPGTITVQATDGTTTAQITVEVPVVAAADAPQVAAATWNLWDNGGHVSDALPKDLAVIAANGLGVIAVQEDGGTGAHRLAQALGWYDYEGGNGLGIVSAWPISATTAATTSVPAVAATVDVAGHQLRVWNTALDETGYGPDRACAPGGADAGQLVAAERSSTRYAQAQAVAAAVKADTAGARPVLLLGGLASPSAADWTAGTAAAHCDAGAVDWPVPDAFAAAGLTDTFRAAHPDPAADPGTTWSPVTATASKDRIDYVYGAGDDLHVLGSNTLVAGWPSATDVRSNAWTSDHAAVVTTVTLGTPQPPAAAPTVAVAHNALVHQAGHGPADDAELRAAVGATASPADAAVTLDTGALDRLTPGWYTVLVTAVADGRVSAPVAVTVHVVPVARLSVGNPTVQAPGLGLTSSAVLAGLNPRLNVPGAVAVDLSTVDTSRTGDYPVTVTGTDEFGFTATASATVRITSADLPPVVTASLSPAAADGADGWYRATPTVSAAATDDSGTAPRIEYQAGDGGWSGYQGPIPVPDGIRTYRFRATDNAGHTSAPVPVTVRADGTAPGTSATTAPGATVIAPVTVTLTAADATSGVVRTEYRVDGGRWTTYTGPFTVAPDFTDRSVAFRSTDAAGNTEPDRQLTVPAIRPVGPELSVAAPAVPYGTAATVRVAVSSPGLPASGTVVLTEGATERGRAVLAQDGTAVLTLPIGLAAGAHPLLVSYGGSALLTPVTRTLTVTVTLPTAWQSSAVYLAGDRVSYQGRLFEASWYARGQQPGDPTGSWQEIALTEDGTAAWTASRVFRAGDLASYGGKVFKARQYTRNQAPGNPNGPWEEQAPAGPDGIAPWTPSTVYIAGDKVRYLGVVYQARWYTRTQTPDTANGPWKKLG